MKKSFTLFELLLSTLVLTLIGSGILGIYTMESAMLTESAHRLEAVNYLKGVADTLLNSKSLDLPSLSVGEHNSENEKDLCALPDNYFKLHLKGAVRYTVKDRKINFIANSATFREIEIKITWEERIPRTTQKKESLFILVTGVPHNM